MSQFSGTVGKCRSFTLVKKQRALVFSLVTYLSLLLLSICCLDPVYCGQVSPSTGLVKTAVASGKESSSSRTSITSSSDDGDSSNHHHHNYHRHHRHSSSPSKSSSSSIYPSSSAYSGYPEYSGNTPLSYSNPADAYYEPRYYERPSREFSARSTSHPAMVAASSSQVGFTDTEYGGLALATGHHGGGHGQHGHGGADAYGHGHQTTYYKTVHKGMDQSSLGLLGLLGLLSLLSNVLLLLTTTAAGTTASGGGGGGGMGGRRKRRDTMMILRLKDEDKLARRSVIERLSHLILPSLNVVGHAKDGRVPLNCTYQEMCKTNRVLVQVFGADEGRPVASVMSTAITKLLANNNDKRSVSNKHNHLHNKQRSNETRVSLRLIEKLLTEAGLAGRNGEDCEAAYPTCNALSVDDRLRYKDSMKGSKHSSSLRLPLLISPERASAIILGQN